MPYSRGDYYRGDYYRGDPGFFDFIKKVGRAVVGTVGGAVGGFISRGPVGGIVGAVAGAAGATERNIEEETLASGGTTTAAQSPEALVALHRKNVARPPGMAIIPRPPMEIGPMMAGGGGGMRRMHPNRSTYVTRGGGTSHWPVGLQVHEKGTTPVPSRRMNVANPRALRRALRRVAGFGKIVHRVRRAVMRAATAVGGHRRSAPRKAIGRR
jgi:hypothetical protein